MADIINNNMSTGFNYHGSVTVSPGKSVVIWTNGFPGAIAVLSRTLDAITYTVNEITDQKEAILTNSFTPIPVGGANTNTSSKIFDLRWGISAYQVVVPKTGKPVTLNWRIVRP